MRTVKIAELKDKLSEYLRAVEAGDEVTVTDRNRPIARIIPAQAGTPTLIIDGPMTPFKSVRTKKWPASGWKLSSGELLDAERGER